MRNILNLLLNKGIRSPKPRPMIVPAPNSSRFSPSDKDLLRKSGLLALILVSAVILIEIRLPQEESDPTTTHHSPDETGLRHLTQRNFNEAVIFYREKLAQNPDHISAQINLAYALKNQNKIREAESIYLSVLKTHPNETVVLNNLGVLYSQTGRLEEAEQTFLRAIKIDERYSDAALNLGFNFEKKSNFSEAILQYQRTLDNPDLKPQQVKFLVERMRQLHAVANAQKNAGEKL